MAEKVPKYPHIKEMRDEKELKQKDIGKILNCSQSVYSRYENGTRDIPSECLIKLARLFNCSTDYLLGLTDDRNPKP